MSDQEKNQAKLKWEREMKVKTKNQVVECAKTWATHCNLIFVFIVKGLWLYIWNKNENKTQLLIVRNHFSLEYRCNYQLHVY